MNCINLNAKLGSKGNWLRKQGAKAELSSIRFAGLRWQNLRPAIRTYE